MGITRDPKALADAVALLRTNRKVSPSRADEVARKAAFFVQDGCFDHHKLFGFMGDDGCLYYTDFFGTGWNKRRPNNTGWCKVQQCMALNVRTGRYTTARIAGLVH